MSTDTEKEISPHNAFNRTNEISIVTEADDDGIVVKYVHSRCSVAFDSVAQAFEHECKADELPHDVRLLLKGRVASDRESRKRERETMRNFILDTGTRLSRLREVIDDEFELLSRITETLDYAERRDRESDEQFARRLVEVESRTLDDAMSDKSDERRSKMANELLTHVERAPPEIKDERWDCSLCHARFYDYTSAISHVNRGHARSLR